MTLFADGFWRMTSWRVPQYPAFLVLSFFVFVFLFFLFFLFFFSFSSDKIAHLWPLRVDPFVLK